MVEFAVAKLLLFRRVQYYQHVRICIEVCVLRLARHLSCGMNGSECCTQNCEKRESIDLLPILVGVRSRPVSSSLFVNVCCRLASRDVLNVRGMVLGSRLISFHGPL